MKNLKKSKKKNKKKSLSTKIIDKFDKYDESRFSTIHLFVDIKLENSIG